MSTYPPIDEPTYDLADRLRTEPTPPHSDNALLRRGKWTYISALLLIATLALASHFVADSIIRRQADTARIVNLSGRQRMLSQRIVKVALERTLHRGPAGDAGAQRVLRESVQRMSEVHQALLHGSPRFGLQPPPPAIREIYTGQQWQLDARVQRFLTHARVVANRPAQEVSVADPDLVQMEEEARAPLLDALDAAVEAGQQFSEQSIQSLRTRLALLTALTLALLLAQAVFLYRPLFQRLTRQQQNMAQIGRVDPLTGCLNRRAFDEMAASAVARCQRSGAPFTLLILDLDHFKTINDTYGHATGDLVLQALVESLLRTTRSSDSLFRIGGEEFAILLPDCDTAAAPSAAGRFLHSVAATPMQHATGALHITLSVGAATLHPADATHLDLLARADSALYAAKRSGRNRVEMAPTPTDPATIGQEPACSLVPAPLRASA